MKRILILLVVIVMASCSSYKKQLAKAQAFYTQYPNELAKVCADKFPIGIQYIKGRDSISYDTTYKTIWVSCPPNGKDTSRIKIPLAIPTVNHHQRPDTIIKTNTAAYDSLKNHSYAQDIIASALRQQVADITAQDKADAHTALMRLFIIIGIGIVIAAGIAIKIYL